MVNSNITHIILHLKFTVYITLSLTQLLSVFFIIRLYACAGIDKQWWFVFRCLTLENLNEVRHAILTFDSYNSEICSWSSLVSKLFLTDNFPSLLLYDNATNSAYSSFAANI